MGRKKTTKINNQENTKVEVTAPVEEKAVAKQKVNYTGSVVVSIQHGRTTISQTKYHNAGSYNLFKFLCSCLAGDYIYNQRPCRLQLFTKAAENDSPDNPIINEETKISSLVYYNTRPKVEPIGNGGCTITYHFRVPFTVIDEDAKIYKLGLYNGDITTTVSEFYALFLFLDEEGTGWKPIGLDENQKNYRRSYALVIDWTLELNNPTVE